MNYTRRTVTSRPGLSQEEALLSLQEHPEFAQRRARVGSIRRRGDRWVAIILEPKLAADEDYDDGAEESPEPPKKEGPPKADASPAGDGDSDDGGPDLDGDSDGGGSDGGPPKPGGEHGEKAEVGQLLHLVQQIADALGVVAPDALAGGPAGPDGMGPGHGGPPAPPPHGGPAGGAGGPGGAPPMGGGAIGGGHGAGHPLGSKLRPGEVPNKPGVVPVGSPAFASTQKPRSFTASTHDPQRALKISSVKADLNRQFPGHQVRQVVRDGEYVRAFLSV